MDRDRARTRLPRSVERTRSARGNRRKRRRQPVAVVAGRRTCIPQRSVVAARSASHHSPSPWSHADSRHSCRTSRRKRVGSATKQSRSSAPPVTSSKSLRSCRGRRCCFSLSGDNSKGADLADEAVALAENIGNDFLSSASLEAAGIARYRTDPERAVELLDSCLGISPSRDSASGGANTYMMKAVAHLALRQHGKAAESLLVALPIMHELDEPYYETICLGTAALLFRRTGRPDAAVQLLAAIDVLRQQGLIVGASRDLESQRQLRHRLESELDQSEFAAAWTEGRTLRLTDAVSFTITELELLIADDAVGAT